jgi:hypothetical protein
MSSDQRKTVLRIAQGGRPKLGSTPTQVSRSQAARDAGPLAQPEARRAWLGLLGGVDGGAHRLRLHQAPAMMRTMPTRNPAPCL